ncbi:integrase catalytic domain-containing protein [Trichonephila clavipes]|nr:integrase catalytic domain-containing protein [Trichonephila clavipes]
MSEYELLGHMEEIKNKELDKINYYIPHHSVYKPEKTSTPLRVVFDASAKTTSDFSLNSILLNGGIIQQVSRFRKHENAFSADIKKIYSPELFKDLSASSYVFDKEFQDAPVKTLGMLWDPEVDCLTYKVKISDKVNFSKRDVLSEIARLYDPLGLIEPIVTKAKIFIQELWKIKLDWSEQLPPDAMEEWKNFYQKLSRKFINNIKAKESCNKNKYLTADEIRRSTEFLAKIAQLSTFKAEIDALKKGKGVLKTSKLKALDPFLDDHSLLRVGGRLSNSDLPFEAKHQIIISSKHKFTKLPFEHMHKKFFHIGAQGLVHQIRMLFWPINGKGIARKTVHDCIACFRQKPTGVDQIMGNLPSERVTNLVILSLGQVTRVTPKPELHLQTSTACQREDFELDGLNVIYSAGPQWNKDLKPRCADHEFVAIITRLSSLVGRQAVARDGLDHINPFFNQIKTFLHYSAQVVGNYFDKAQF